MTNNEEFNRKMAFILDQQAQFATDIQRMREKQEELQLTQAQTENVVGRLAHATLEGFKDVNAKIDALVDAHIRLSKSQARTEKNLALTDENLRSLIAVVDRHVREEAMACNLVSANTRL
jgi:hypothetical protein